MARGEQLARQWKLIQMLLTSPQGRTIRRLCEALACTRRTLYRDLEALQQAGFPLYNYKQNGTAYWSLVEGYEKPQIPLPLDVAELTALYLSRFMLKAVPYTVFHHALDSLFQKVKTTLPQRLLNSLDAFSGNLSIRTFPHAANPISKRLFDDLNSAVDARHYVDIDYYTPSRRKQTRRRIAPYRLTYYDGAFYLVAYCNLRRAIRIFALNRIRFFETTLKNFEFPSEFDIDAYLQDSFGIFAGKTERISIRFLPEVADYISDRIWHPSQQLHHLEDGSLIMELEVAGMQEIKAWVLKWGQNAAVIGPDRLKRDIGKELKTMLSYYDP